MKCLQSTWPSDFPQILITLLRLIRSQEKLGLCASGVSFQLKRECLGCTQLGTFLAPDQDVKSAGFSAELDVPSDSGMLSGLPFGYGLPGISLKCQKKIVHNSSGEVWELSAEKQEKVRGMKS